MAKIEESNGNETSQNAVNGEGGFYHIEIKSPVKFKRFRTQNVGKKGGIERVGGQRNDGTWETIKWLIAKGMAHIENGKLIADHNDVKKLFIDLKIVPIHIEGDTFEAKT